MPRRNWARRCYMTLRGKYALVTGGSRGIGRGIALKLAECGAKVAVHYYQKEDHAKATLEKLRACGTDGFVLQADVCKPEEIRRMFARVKSEFGALDIFVSYAPGGRFGSWQPWVATGAAKAALEVLCRYFAVALAPRQITVNAISPGWTEDSVLNTLPEAAQDMIRNWHQSGWTPMRKLGTPADPGNAVSLLCSPEANWITGQILDVDGGASLMDSHLPLEMQGLPAASSAHTASA